MKKALVVGIDEYHDGHNLSGCVNDAIQVSAAVERNGDGAPNFEVRQLVSTNGPVCAGELHEAITELLSGEAETAFFYFAGHGMLNEETNNGHLVTYDGKSPNWGVSLASILDLANKAYPAIKSTVIVLDSCQSGYAGEVPGLAANGAVSVIGTGVTILTACHRQGTAAEADDHGTFTAILLDGLAGSAADVMGRITPASVYAHVDQTLGAWEQRPIYKANVQSFITLREVEPRVALDILRKLPKYFPNVNAEFELDPSFEPERGEEAEKLRDVPVDEDNERIYRDLQKCNRHGLVVPVEHEHMWHSAVFGGRVRLTASGAHYRKLAELGRI